MGFLDFLAGNDINSGIDEYKASDGGVLIDVRTPEEFRAGHVPGAKNIPLDTLSEKSMSRFRKDAPLFVYCRSGARSSRAVGFLKEMGFANAKNIGGIASYRGEAVS